MIPGSWSAASGVVLGLVIVVGIAAVLRKRPDHRPHIRVGLDARHGCRPQRDERDSIALFRRIQCDHRARLGF